MDSGFLSSSTETPKVPEQAPVNTAPELVPQTNQPVVEAQPFNEAKLESEAVQTQSAVQVVAQEPAQNQAAAVPAPAVIAVPPDKIAEDVQKILEDGLEEAIVTMPEDAKQRFLQKGKEIGTIVSDMVRHYKVEVKRVLSMLKEWLTAIPGINKFFLEKEAKIKTDRILELERVQHEAAPA